METIISGGDARVVQIRRARAGGMTKAKRRRFFEVFAATCNATTASKAVGLSLATVYAHRKKDPSFATAWAEALQAGRERLEEALLAHALKGFEKVEFDPAAVPIELVDAAGADPDADGATRPARAPKLADKVALVDIQLALSLVNRREAVDRRGRGGSRPKSVDEVEKALGAKLDSLARRLGPLA